MSGIILALLLIVTIISGRAIAAEFVDYGTQHQLYVEDLEVRNPLSLHICANNAFMIGAHVKANQFVCEDTFPIVGGLWGGPASQEPQIMFRHGGPAAIISNVNKMVRYQSHGMAACPPGTAMVGLHHAENVLACAPLPEVYRQLTTVELSVDAHSYRLFGGVNIHVCPKGWFMVGIHEARDLLLCGSIKRK